MQSLYENLRVYKKSLELVMYFENSVRSFDRYHKYTVGTELRNLAREVLVLVAKANTKKEVLFSVLQGRIKNPDVLWLTKTVLFWDCTKSYVALGEKHLLSNIPEHKSLFGKDNKCGLPIGNLTSQFFANVYLNELDQYVKHTIKARYYLRYVDDFVILSHDKDELICMREQIRTFVADKLKIKLHPKRHKLLPVSSGIDFLGYVVRHNYILVRRRVVNNLKQKIRAFMTSNKKDYLKFNLTLASYAGHFKHANAYRLKKSFLKIIGNERQEGKHEAKAATFKSCKTDQRDSL